MNLENRDCFWKLSSQGLLGDSGIIDRARKVNYQKIHTLGKFIVFDGVDGAGKSTSIELASKFLSVEGIEHECIDLLSKEFRSLSMHRHYADDHTRSLDCRGSDQPSVGIAALADRLHRYRTIFHEKLSSGKWIICDRYAFTPLAEAIGLGVSDLDLDALYSVASLLPEPSLGFSITLPESLAIQRIRERPDEIHKRLDVDFYRRAIASYCALAKCNGYVLLDTSRGLELVENEIQNQLRKLLGAI